MPSEKNIVAGNNQSKPVLIDVFTANAADPQPVVVFFHGTKGFKDWGYWPHMYQQFNHAGIALVTVNFSHNGVRFPDMEAFTDLQGFSTNTISLELQDMKIVMDWLLENAEKYNLNASDITFCGHSRGGANVLVYAAKDNRVNKVVAWSPITSYIQAYNQFDAKEWEKTGFITTKNSRTGQNLKVNYSFYTDVTSHTSDFDVVTQAALLEIPVLLIHGTNDDSVPVSSSRDIHNQCLHALLITIQQANHTFGLSHPHNTTVPLPHTAIQLLENTIEFILD